MTTIQNVAHFVHAYRQAPWRVQRQWTGAFLLALLAIAMVSALYLEINARAALVGREIQGLEFEIASVQRANADMVTQLAILQSKSVMETRASALGFRLAEPGEIHYLVVPGYSAPQAVQLAETQPPLSAPSIPPEYTQSLLEWFAEKMHASLGAGQ
jgi:cell division protein FtsB